MFNGNGDTISGSEFGIVVSALDVTVANNTITETGSSVILPGPPVSVANPTAGIFIIGRSNVISENNLKNNICGIIFLETSKNLIVGNNITDSTDVAFDLYESSNNSLYHNNIIGNANNVEDDAFGFSGAISVNTWDDGYPAGGNYWSDYQTKYPNATEIDNSGIGNTPYVITYLYLEKKYTIRTKTCTRLWNPSTCFSRPLRQKYRFYHHQPDIQ